MKGLRLPAANDDVHDLQPCRALPADALELLAGVPVYVAVQYLRPVRQVGQDDVGDREFPGNLGFSR